MAHCLFIHINSAMSEVFPEGSNAVSVELCHTAAFVNEVLLEQQLL